MKGQKIPYTKTGQGVGGMKMRGGSYKATGVPKGAGHQSGVVLGPYVSQPALNRKQGHRNNGGSDGQGKGRAYNKKL